MIRLTVATRLWFVALAIAASAMTVATAKPGEPIALVDVAALLLCGISAGIAHRFPIRVTGEASCRLTNVFLVAGAILLPPILLPPLVLAALLPDTLLVSRRGTSFMRLFANLPPTALAVVGTGLWLDWGGYPERGTGAVLAFAGAGASVTLLQGLLLGIGMALQFGLPLRQTDPLRPAALQADAIFAILGIAVAGLWRAEPLLLSLVLPLLLFLTHHLTRQAQLGQLAQRDVKTGLHNAAHFERQLAAELARSGHTNRPLAVLFADLDHFKAINDRHGHVVGDRALHSIGTLLAATLRNGDVIARFGGEEFVALLPNTDADEALFLAELVRATIESHPFTSSDGTTVRMTITVGVASAPHDGATVEALLTAADAAMYRAKQTRNTVALAGRLPSVPRLASAPPTRPTAAPSGPPRRAVAIIWATIALGALSFLASLPALLAAPDWLLLALLIVLGVAAEFVTIQIFESESQKYSLTFGVVVMLAAATALPAGAPLVAVVAALVHVVQRRQWRRGIDRALFNLAGPCLAAGVAAGCYSMLTTQLPHHPVFALLAAGAAAGVFYGVNTGAVVLAMATHSGRAVSAIFGEARWAAPATLLLGLTGAFLGAQFGALGPLNAALFALPLLVMRYTLGFAARKTGEALATLRAAKVEAESAHEEKEQTLRQLIDVVAAIIDARDQAVAGHSDRVATYAVALAAELGLSPREQAYLHTAGLLHDLGKIAVPEAILHKPAKLSAEEFAVVKEHAALGERILAEVRPLAEVARMVGDHHERYDGTGYPNREAGAAITRGGRIVAVADTLDSILSDRPYSKGKPLPWALEELRRCAGSHFDPDVVAALERLAATRGPAFFTSVTTSSTDAAPPHIPMIPVAPSPSGAASR